MADDGWITLPGADGVTVHVRAQWHGSVYRITDLYLHSADGITPASKQALSISRLEAELNLVARPGAVLADAPTVAAIFRAARPHDDNTPEPSLAELRARKPTPRSQRPPLTRPDRQRPDPFYREVALAYREYAPQTRAPAKAMANEAGVPVATAQRWIGEARRRGHLPPARKGRAG